ncbi:hypothetical protein Nwi_0638 [Nitrobacter winogradskyi Nb-255]|uniref:Uncharacterized protein n=1 Tax=Nitrobacter winogradskyi (strain ATCC 25391 / DSM 10237 / CIP 104748 / NCIMB 11846 / Nb-255) TaxID=323098 RepID=Q3SUY6_NITWN|nr:hypothetical protein Nwi_0638 [Nitrobacter winogradskyi Nb-255]
MRFRETRSAAKRQMGGGRRSSLRAIFPRDWLLKRLSEQPDVTLRAARGAGRAKVSYYVVRRFFEHEAISFKKPARRRTGSSRRRAAAGAKVSG